MKPEEFDKALAAGKIAPLYYIYGEESYLVERAVKRLLAKTVDPSFQDFNLTTLYANECKNGEQIVETAQTLPMFADRRVVLVKRCSELSQGALDLLQSYIQDPSPTTCLIFQGEKIDKRKKFFLDFQKKGELLEFKRPYENQLGAFIREEAATHGKKIEPAAVELIIYLVGNNLQDISAQMEKLATFATSRPALTLSDVQTIVADTRSVSVFDLANAVGARELGKAIRLLRAMLRDGEAPLMILGMLTRHFRQLWQVSELLQKRASEGEIASAVGINPYFLKGVMEQARKFRIPEYKPIFELFFNTDLALKSSGGKPASIMEMLMVDICGTDGGKKGKR
jgi:DNA polymerase-3 subunit delta